MRKYLFIAYPVWLYVLFTFPALIAAALLKTLLGTDPLIAHMAGAAGMCLTYMAGKRKRMKQLPAVPWKRIFRLSGLMLAPVATLTVILTGKAFSNLDWNTYLPVVLGTFFWASLSEELLFREFLITRMKETGMTAWVMIPLTALLFSLCHRPETGSLFLQRLVTGMLLGYLYLGSGDIALTVSTHWIYNTIVYTFQTTLPSVTLLYSSGRAGLNVLLCLLSLLGTVVVYSINKSKFAGYT